jgi:hypothetical protein
MKIFILIQPFLLSVAYAFQPISTKMERRDALASMFVGSITLISSPHDAAASGGATAGKYT